MLEAPPWINNSYNNVGYPQVPGSIETPETQIHVDLSQ